MKDIDGFLSAYEKNIKRLGERDTKLFIQKN